MRRPSGDQAQPYTPDWWSARMARQAAEVASQMHSVLSSEAETMHRPSGDQAPRLTQCWWPVATATFAVAGGSCALLENRATQVGRPVLLVQPRNCGRLQRASLNAACDRSQSRNTVASNAAPRQLDSAKWHSRN